MTEHISPAELVRRTHGSLESHETLLDAVRRKLQLEADLESIPIYTGGIPRYLPGGALTLRKNPDQEGFADVFLMYLDTLQLHGREVVISRAAFLEMKTGRARRSAAQVKRKRHFESFGAVCPLVRTVDDVDFIVRAHLKAKELLCRKA